MYYWPIFIIGAAMRKSMKVFALGMLSLLASCGGGSDGQSAAATPRLAATVTQVRAQAVRQLADYKDVVEQIYVAYFGRPADAGGLAYFEAQFLAAGAPTTLAELSVAYGANPAVKALVDSFSASAESAALYSGDNDAFIQSIYLNLFNRAADSAGKAYWADMINRGLVTRANAAVSVMAGAQSTDSAIVRNKTQVAATFTAGLDTDAKAKAYSGLGANAFIRSVLRLVSDTTDLLVFQATLDSAITDLIVPVVTVPVVTLPPVVIGKQCYVNGYYRSNGTYVHGYWRRC
jgi:hypothetical protein